MSDMDIRGVPLGDPEEEFQDPWYLQFKRSQVWADAEYPKGYGIALVGRHAWAALPDEHRSSTMDIFFQDYWLALRDEEHEVLLARQAKDGTSYIKPSDMPDLWLYIHEAKGDPEEIKVPRQQLINVLSELELLQYRLACIERGKEIDRVNATDSGESK